MSATGGGLGDLTVVLNGVTVTIEDVNGATRTDNAYKIADAINAVKSTTKVTATVTGGSTDQITLTHDNGGSGNDIAITFASADTGLTAATTSGTNLNTITSARPIGIAQASSALDNARLDTAVTAGAGSFTINAVTFTYDTTSDTLNSIISDINAYSAGVTAAYDSVEGKILLTADATGSEAIAMANVTGNFLTAVGLLAGTQTLGDQAKYSIDVLAGGATQTSSGNTITNALPGITVTLSAVDTTNPITVTVSQDIGTALGNAQSLVDQFNSTVTFLEEKIAFDAESEESGLLIGDSTVTGILRNLRTLVLADGDGLTGEFKSLVDVGFSFDAVGSDSLLLSLDREVFGTALVENPDGVSKLFSARTTSSSITTSSGTVVASITGTEDFRKRAGTYTLVLDTAASPNLTVTFVPDDGGNTIVTTNTVAASEVTSGVIPGVTMTFEAGGTFASGNRCADGNRPDERRSPEARRLRGRPSEGRRSLRRQEGQHRKPDRRYRSANSIARGRAAPKRRYFDSRVFSPGGRTGPVAGPAVLACPGIGWADRGWWRRGLRLGPLK